MAESLNEMLVFQKLIEGKSSFDINAIYAPILIIMIIWYLLNQNNNLCSNCKNAISHVPRENNMQKQVSYMYSSPLVDRRIAYLENPKPIEYNPY